MSWPMTFGILCWMISSLGVFQLAYAIYRPLRSDRPAMNAVCFMFLLMFAATLIGLTMGLAGLLRPAPMAVLGGGIVTIIGLLGPDEIKLTRVSRDLSHLSVHAKAWWGGMPLWLKWLSGFGLVVSVLRFSFLVLALPPFVWDALTYHLTNVAQWTQQGRIELFETPVVRIYSPANFEVLTTWFTVFLHHDVLIEASGIPSYVLSILAVYATCRGLGYSRRSSWLAAMAYGSTPALLLATTGTKNDPQVTAMFLCLVAIAVNLVWRRQAMRETNSLGQVVLALLIALYAFGTKTYIAHLLSGVVLLAALGPGRTRSARRWSEIFMDLRDRLGRAGAGLRVTLATLVLAGVFVGGYWNVRNWILTGNPFFPYGVTIGDQQVLPSGDRTAHLGLERLVANLEQMGHKFGDRFSPIVPDLPETTGWGWFAYGLGLPALAWMLVRRSDTRLVFAGFTLSLLVLFLSDRPSPWSMRYAIWFPALFALAFAAYLDWLPAMRPGYSKMLIGLTVLSFGLNFVMTINEGRVGPEDFQAMLGRSIWDRQAAYLRLTVPEEYANALEFVPRDAVLGYNVTSNGFVYPLYRADFSQHLAYIPLSADESCDDVALALDSHGTRYLFVAPEQTDDKLRAMLAKCAGSGSVIRERARGLYVVKESN
jgi:hypothetical protein